MTASVTLHVQDPEIENERGKTGRRGLRERDREADSEKGETETEGQEDNSRERKRVCSCKSPKE